MANGDRELEDGDCIKADYMSRDVVIPADFLVAEPPDARPITAKPIDWRETNLPEFASRYAILLDHVLSPSECDTLLRMAEDSVKDRGRSGTRRWSPALVNIGGGLEALDKEYRNSDRIVWDNQTIMDRLWMRCIKVKGLQEELAVVVDPPSERRRRQGIREDSRWEFERLNQRGRFLRYTQGQFFRRKCPTVDLPGQGTNLKTRLICSPLRRSVLGG